MALSQISVYKIREALGLSPSKDLPEDPAYWTKGRAIVAADTITEHFPSPATATKYLGGLRNHLKQIEADPESIKATLRPEITIKHNLKNEMSRKRRVQEGIEIPDVFLFGRLQERVEGYLREDAPLSPQMAADFLVALSGRRKEGETLNLTETGGVQGVLKTRNKEPQNYEIKSCLPHDMAVAFLDMWDQFPEVDRAHAIKQAESLAASWNLQIRDLRAVGSYLAAGNSKNVGTYLETASTALRHKKPKNEAPIMSYARVNEPNRELYQMISMLPEPSLRKVEGVVRELYLKKYSV